MKYNEVVAPGASIVFSAEQQLNIDSNRLQMSHWKRATIGLVANQNVRCGITFEHCLFLGWFSKWWPVHEGKKEQCFRQNLFVTRIDSPFKCQQCLLFDILSLVGIFLLENAFNKFFDDFFSRYFPFFSTWENIVQLLLLHLFQHFKQLWKI